MLKEFKINEFLSLRLEEGKTFIYVKDVRFDQCKFLLLDISTDQTRSIDEIESIDEAAEKLDRSLEVGEGSRRIPPETEFWGHCSNLQAWYEHEYNTRLLHRNLAFPLLRRLADCGDPLAKKVFKEEIAKRFESGFLPVVLYLMKEKYLHYFIPEELNVLMTKDEIWQGVLTALEAIRDEVDKRYAFSDLIESIKGTDVMRERFIDLVTVVEIMPYDEDKRDLFSTMVSAIKGTSLMDEFSSQIETLFSNILIAVGSIPDGDAFYTLASAIKGADVMREKCPNLIATVEIMPDGRDKSYVFSYLVSAIEGTDVMDAFSSRIEILFSNVLATVETMPDDEDKSNAFSDLISAIKGTNLTREKFTDLLTAVEAMPDGWVKQNVFRKWVNVIKGTGVMREKFTDLLTAMEAMPDDHDKRYAFSTLVSAVKKTELIREKFTDLLTALETMPDGLDKVVAFSTLVSAIKGTELMREKFTDLVTMVETMPDGEYKRFTFSDLVKLIKGTDVMDAFSSRIETLKKLLK